MTRIPFIPRTDDEAILTMLAMRDRGLTRGQSAMRIGVTKGTVSGALFRVDRDLAKSEAVK